MTDTSKMTLNELADCVTALEDELYDMQQKLEYRRDRPQPLEWRKTVSRWSAFMDLLKTAPIPRHQRTTAAAIKQEIDRYLQHGPNNQQSE